MELGGAGQEGLAGKPVGEEPPVPASRAQQTSSDLSDVLKAAPVLKTAPGVALAVARYGGNVTENAQQVAAVAHARAIETGASRLYGDVGPEADLKALESQSGPLGTRAANSETAQLNQLQPQKKGQGILGDIVGGVETAGKAVGGAFHGVVKTAQQEISGTQNNNPAAAGTGLGTGGGKGPQGNIGGPAEVQLQQYAGKTLSAGIGAVAQQANPNTLFTFPAHTFRYLYEIDKKKGAAAMIRAAVPLIGGSAAGILLTHNPEEAAAAGKTALELAGEAPKAAEAAAPTALPEATASRSMAVPTSEVPAPPEGGGLTAAQQTGQTAKNVTQAVLSPAVAVGKAVTKGINTVATSPAALGGETAQFAAGNAPASPISDPRAWQATANASTWKLPNGKQGPTFGQWVAGGVLHTNPHSTAYNLISGTLDATMMVAAPDPLGAAGRVLGKAKSAEGFGDSFLGRHMAGGTASWTPSAVEANYTQNPVFRNFINQVPGMSPGEIVQKFANFTPDLVAKRLSEASTPAEALDVYKELARVQELTTTSAMPEAGLYTAAKQAGRDRTTLFTPVPTSLNPDTLHFSSKEMNMLSPDAVHNAMLMLRGAGEEPTVVREVGTAMAATRDPQMRATILRNGLKTYIGNEIKKALPSSAPDDFKQVVLDKMNEAIDNLTGGAGPGHVGQFGRDNQGHDLSQILVNTGDPATEGERSAGIWPNQAGQFKMPALRAIKSTITDLAQMEQWTAKNAVLSRGLTFEQAIDSTINEKIFQPLALATAGWATRVSVSEMALNIARQGPLNFTAGRIAASAAKQDWKIATNDEITHVVAAVRGILSGVDTSVVKGLGKERLLDAAVASTLMFNGHVVAPALDATHTPLMQGTDQPERALADIRAEARRSGVLPTRGVKFHNAPLSDTYTIMAPGTTGYHRAWSEYAGRVAHDDMGRFTARTYQHHLDMGLNANQAAAATIPDLVKYIKDELPGEKGMSAEVRSGMARNTANADLPGHENMTPHQSWATAAVAALRGATEGKDGTIYHELLDDIVKGTVPDVKGMAARYSGKAERTLPPAMPGREVSLKTDSVIQRASNSLHSHILGPIVNALSREPTWVVDFAQERKILEKQVASGAIDKDAADVLAATRASYKSIKFVHNPQDRLKIENMLHTFAPFYFAQNQSIRRMMRLFNTNPGALEQHMKVMLGLNNVAHQVTLKNGLPTFIIPGSTLGGMGITSVLGQLGIAPKGSIPIGLTGAADVSTTIDPFSSADTSSGVLANPLSEITSALKPSFGPVVSIPAKMITDLFGSKEPIIAAIANKALGPVASNEPLWMQFVPNSILQHGVEGLEGLKSQGQDSLGASYTSAFLGLMAAYAEAGDLPDPHTLAGPDPQTKAAFIRKVNNATFALWMGRTLVAGTSPISVALGRANLAFSNLATEYINKAGGNVSKGLDAMTRAHPNLVPSEVFQSTASGGYAFPETDKAQAWVSERLPWINKYPTASRWLMPNTDATGKFSYNAYTFELAHGLRTKDTPSEFFDQLYISSGNAYLYDVVYPQIDAAIAQKPNDKSWAYQVWTKADTALQNYGQNLNPIWWKDYSADPSKSLKGEAVDQMKSMLADPQTPQGPLTEHLGFLVNLYDQFQGEKTQGRMTSAQLKAQWGALMGQATTQYPDLKPVIQGVFQGLG